MRNPQRRHSPLSVARKSTFPVLYWLKDLWLWGAKSLVAILSTWFLTFLVVALPLFAIESAYGLRTDWSLEWTIVTAVVWLPLSLAFMWERSGHYYPWSGLWLRIDEALEPAPEHFNIWAPFSELPIYRCPCCHHRTLHERGMMEICEVCFWRDDGQDDHDAEVVRRGFNEPLSLAQARENYAKFGASDAKYMQSVRKPTDSEL